MFITRPLEDKDALDIVALAKEHHAASRYAHIPFEGERVFRFCHAAAQMPEYGAVVLVDEETDTPAGYCCITVEPYMWSDFTIARELALYVRPAARGFPQFRSLISAAEGMARAKGAHTVDFGMTTPCDEAEARRYGKLYVTMGYAWHGETYRKEIQQ